MHLGNGSIKLHHASIHQSQLTRKNLNENTIILDRQSQKTRRTISEAVHIYFLKPVLNIQQSEKPSLPSV